MSRNYHWGCLSHPHPRRCLGRFLSPRYVFQRLFILLRLFPLGSGTRERYIPGSPWNGTVEMNRLDFA